MKKDPMEVGRLLGQWLQILSALNTFRQLGAWPTDGGRAARS